MRRADDAMARAVLLRVTLDGGETVEVPVSLVFGSEGELRQVLPAPVAPRDPREAAARRLVARVSAELARPNGASVLAIQREAERVAALAETLLELEERHGPAVVAAARQDARRGAA